MHNPFEKDTKEYQVYAELVKIVCEDDRYTPLELAEMTHRCIANPASAPDAIKYQQLTLFDPAST
jgi:hypothetical protein